MNILETILKIKLHPVSRETNFDGFLDTKKISTNDFNLLSFLITFPIKIQKSKSSKFLQGWEGLEDFRRFQKAQTERQFAVVVIVDPK